MHDATPSKRYVVGVCAMRKKTSSKPMQEILRRLDMRKQFNLVLFDDDTILNKPVQDWPVCDALISFYSSGFPLHKAEEYVTLQRPVLVNDLHLQRILFDRRDVYAMLMRQGVPVPRHAVVNRDKPDGTPDDDVEETDNYVVVHGVRINKPFVEKPVDAEDHNVYIYYPTSAGGGSKRLFRKVGDRSSEFYPDCIRIRRDGSYIYEEFLNTQGTDVKVYTVGSSYAHAEARKSPVLDGRVMRDSAGKEVRYPVILNSVEKEIARKVCLAFHQTVCGFDLLRVRGTSYVCDVNGWSFVKNSKKYYDDCGLILHNYLVSALRLRYFRLRRSGSCGSPLGQMCPQYAVESSRNGSGNLNQEWTRPTSGSDASESSVSSSGTSGAYDDETKEELRCVIAVVRHGDRTPKQKLKTVVWAKEVIDFYTKRCTTPGTEALKVKAVAEMQELLELVRTLIATYAPDGVDVNHRPCWEVDGGDNFEKLVQTKRVLERWKFAGINRKVQFKPRHRWSDDGSQGTTARKELLMIIKWGGDLTDVGKRQGEELGKGFRNRLYPVEEGGLLRLHSTFRHDLKLYTSDEGRVQMTAAAFAKGFLQLEGDLTPILVSLVTTLGKDANKMLDHSGQEGATEEIQVTKAKLRHALQQPYRSRDELVAAVAPLQTASIVKALDAIGSPVEALGRLHDLIGKMQSEIQELAYTPGADIRFPLYSRETLSLMSERWEKLHREFRSEKTGEFDLSKIPDIYDCIKYDLLHNSHLQLSHSVELFQLAENFANLYVPQEYGMTMEEKQSIGIQISQALCAKIRADIVAVMSASSSDSESGGLNLANASMGNSFSTSSNSLDTDGLSTNAPTTTPGETVEQVVEHLGYRLDPTYAKELRIKSPSTQVRTRLYFTSESHLYALLNVLRFQCASWRKRHDQIASDGGQCVVSTEEESFSNRILQAMGIKVARIMPRRKYMLHESKMITDTGSRALDDISELSYLAHVVIRVFERTVQEEESEDRFRVEISFSSGVATGQGDEDDDGNATTSTSPVAEPIYLTTNMTGVLFEEMLAACVASVPATAKKQR